MKKLGLHHARLKGISLLAGGIALLLMAPALRGQMPGLNKYAMAGEVLADQFQWTVVAEVSAAAGGEGTIALPESSYTLPDGTPAAVFASGVPVTVEDGADTETVVPTQSDCRIGGPAPCTLTAAFRYAHQGRLRVISGTSGLLEAAQFAARSGAAVLLTPGRYAVGASITLPANVALRFRPGAVLAPDPAVTVTIDGQIQAGDQTIFAAVPPRTVADAAMANGSDQLSSTSADFTVQDVGSKLYVAGAASATAFGAHLPLVGTITAVLNATTAVASFSNASGTDLAGAAAMFGGSYVAFGGPSAAALNPMWWGADATAKVDSTAAFDAAFTAGGDSGIPVVIPPGRYLVGNLDGGDPMQLGNSDSVGGIPGAAAIRGSGRTLEGGAGPGETDLIYDGPGGGYVLQRNNMQGVAWRDFTVDGSGRAGCLDASWAIPPGGPGPADDDVVTGITAENCAGTGFDLDNQNDSVISNLREINTSDWTTTAAGGVAAGGTAPLALASAAAVLPDTALVVGSGATQETVVVASVSGNAVTPQWPWRFPHAAGEPVTVPAVALRLRADTGEQSLENVDLYGGVLDYDVQNGVITGGWIGDGMITGDGAPDAIQLSGVQIASNRDDRTAIFALQGGTHITCDGCGLTVAAGGYGFAGVFAYGARLQHAFVTLGPGAEIFGPITNYSAGAVFHFVDTPLPGGTPNAAGVNWTIRGQGGQTGVLVSQPFTVASASAAAVPLVISAPGGGSADLQQWQSGGQTVGSVDPAGDLTAQGTASLGALALHGGSPLTGQSGSGAQIVTNAGAALTTPTLASPVLTGTPTLPASYLTPSGDVSQPAGSGTLALTSQLPLAGTTEAIGGAALSAGACASGTAAVSGANVGMAVIATPQADPGTGLYWQGFVSAEGTVTVRVCAAVSATPVATAYTVRVLP